MPSTSASTAGSSTTSTSTPTPSSSGSLAAGLNNSGGESLSASKLVAMLATQTEKPSHYKYLKEFRVEQCPLFPQHKCTQHRPFTCFYWHFPNQRRRRPILKKRDGMFNYSPDTYCTKYDETNGTCPDGDDCPFLHRTAGDTERRYHLRYFKTCMCVYETDTRGFCVKNGAHCAFAHGEHDKRPPVFDIKELQQQIQENADDGISGPNQLDKERNMMIDDPKWQDANYVLMNYKTEACKKPPRLCRQGYACPQFHNLRDRRRSPKKFKYRSTPCPNVKHGDEWGEPTQCDDGDECAYCHTRTEQQFHPEIYKSTKCHDVFTNNYCPRGPFCAFAHADHEMSINRILPTDTNLGDILSNVLPTSSSAASVALCGLNSVGPIGSKPGESMNGSSNNGNGSNSSTAVSISAANMIQSNNAGLDGMGGFLGGLPDFSDVLRNSCRSPPEQLQQHNNYGFGNNGSSSGANNLAAGVAFGTQSFASAAAGGSTVDNRPSNNNNGSHPISSIVNHHSGKFFDDRREGNLIGSAQGSIVGSLMNGPVGSSWKAAGNGTALGNHQSLYDNIDNAFSMGFPMDPDKDYSLFPSAGLKQSDQSRDDSPSVIEKDLEMDHFTSGGSKPVTIPVSSSVSSNSTNYFNRERFPSGSSSMGNSLNNSFQLGSMFSKPDSVDQADMITNQLGLFDFSSPRTSTLSPRTTTVGSNGLSSSGVSSSIGGGVAPGPVGSTASSTTNSMNGVMGIISRPDLCYQNIATLQHYLKQTKNVVDALSKAISTLSDKDSANYSCLICKQKDKPRTIVLLPCDHQVLCNNCYAVARSCPLCGAAILSRKVASQYPSDL
ncbi:unnamed protein product [Orchesella dallaii]|uniref:RING finger protein unkempt n=1 Tax=Orchesella dallaii TaxID=48710 RepID=A0ABP1QAG9_9HEXA